MTASGRAQAWPGGLLGAPVFPAVKPGKERPSPRAPRANDRTNAALPPRRDGKLWRCTGKQTFCAAKTACWGLKKQHEVSTTIMVQMLVVRAGATEFDEQGRIKGTLDIPLSE